MDTFNALLHGFGVALTPLNLLWAFVGCVLGTAIGVLPGVGPALAIAMLMPVTAKVDPASALIMFSGIYAGAMYGGSTTSILLNTPGTSGSIMTAMEGNQMAKRGRAAQALATAAIGSFVAGTIGTVLLTVSAHAIAELGLLFGPAEYFFVMVLAFTATAAVLGESTLRGLTSLVIGLVIGLVGIDSISGQARFTLGAPQLFDGIDVVVVAVGLFAVAEALYIAAYHGKQPDQVLKVSGSLWMSRDDWRRSWPAWLRGTGIGFPFGVLPAGGAEIPTFLSYSAEKKLSKYPEQFGQGAIEGVAGPEAANNASTAGLFVPLLTLGIPTTATAALMLAAFQNYGINPGPLLFANQPELVWGLIASMFVANVLLLVLNLPLVGLWAKLLKVPRPQMYGAIIVFSMLGAYSLRQSLFDIALLLAIGVLGFVMKRFSFPVAPVLIGMILGPAAERYLRNALAIAQGNPLELVTRPLSAALLAITVSIVLIPWLLRKRAARAAKRAEKHPPVVNA